MKKLRQAMLSLWFDDQTPSTDPPAEIIGVMVGKGGEGVNLERSQQFASDVLRIHWNGECACQHPRVQEHHITTPRITLDASIVGDMERSLNGVLWLKLNIHQYGTEPFLRILQAAMEDCEKAHERYLRS